MTLTELSPLAWVLLATGAMVVGFAKTATMRAQNRVPLGEAGYMAKRLDYLDYVAAAPQPPLVERKCGGTGGNRLRLWCRVCGSNGWRGAVRRAGRLRVPRL